MFVLNSGEFKKLDGLCTRKRPYLIFHPLLFTRHDVCPSPTYINMCTQCRVLRKGEVSSVHYIYLIPAWKFSVYLAWYFLSLSVDNCINLFPGNKKILIWCFPCTAVLRVTFLPHYSDRFRQCTVNVKFVDHWTIHSLCLTIWKRQNLFGSVCWTWSAYLELRVGQ